eukprot:EG_transcript_25180
MSSAVPHRPSSARHGHRLPDPAAVAEQWERALRRYNAHTNIYSSAAYAKLPWHVEDSWRLARRVAGQAVLDLGSGSGLPAVFLAAGTAPAEVYAVESKSRKTRFLKEVKSELVPWIHWPNPNSQSSSSSSFISVSPEWLFDGAASADVR